jgi:ElaB/YqjD/DUF883 family membrane-anchored ribosome-binding protein
MPMTPQSDLTSDPSPEATNLGGSAAATDDGDGIKSHLSQLAQAAKEQASAAVAPIRDNARSVVEEQKERGASRIDDLAQALNNAAQALDEEIPQAATYVHSAADQLGKASSLLRDNSIEDLIKKATEFAEERPVVFVAGAVAAGFLLARLLRSSAGASSRGTESRRYGRDSEDA